MSHNIIVYSTLGVIAICCLVFTMKNFLWLKGSDKDDPKYGLYLERTITGAALLGGVVLAVLRIMFFIK